MSVGVSRGFYCYEGWFTATAGENMGPRGGEVERGKWPCLCLRRAIFTVSRVAMERAPQYIRLFFATAGALSSVVFVAGYSFLMAPIIRVRIHHRFEAFPMVTEYFLHYSWYALVIPLIVLILGVGVLRAKKVGVMFEILVGCQWLFTFLWPALCLFAWLLPEVPYSDTIH